MAVIRIYVDADTGNNANDGLTAATAVLTLAYAITLVSLATTVDQKYILLKGGTAAAYTATNSGLIIDRSSVDGAVGIDLYIGTYGSGVPATINVPSGIGTGNTSGVSLKNGGGIWMDNIIITGPNVPGTSQATAINSPWNGVSLCPNLTGTTSHAYKNIKFTRMNVSGGDIGILPGWSTAANADYYDGITVYDSVFHDNAEHGYASFTDPAGHRSTNMLVERCMFYNNPGRLGVGASGNGVLLGMFDNTIFRSCAAWNNGAGNNQTAGPVSMWFTYCDNSGFYNCEMYAQGAQTTDGAGGDFDNGATHCVYDACYMHGNVGPAIMFFGSSTNNEVRFCVFSNNDTTLGILGVEVRHSLQTSGCVLKNNSVFTPKSGSSNRSFIAGEGTVSTNVFRQGNNLVVMSSTSGLTCGDYTSGKDSAMTVTNNYYWNAGNSSPSGAGIWRFAAGVFVGVNSLPAGAGTESGSTIQVATPVPGISNQAGMTAPPTLSTSSGLVPTQSLSYCDPIGGSPLLSAGAAIASASGVTVPVYDFRGTELTSFTTPIGAVGVAPTVSSVTGSTVTLAAGQISYTLPAPVVAGSAGVSQRVTYSASKGYCDPSGTWYAPWDTVGDPVTTAVTVTVRSVVDTTKTGTITINPPPNSATNGSVWGWGWGRGKTNMIASQLIPVNNSGAPALPLDTNFSVLLQSLNIGLIVTTAGTIVFTDLGGRVTTLASQVVGAEIHCSVKSVSSASTGAVSLALPVPVTV